MKVHIWRKYNGNGTADSWCGRSNSEARKWAVATGEGPQETTCQHCARSRLAHALWKSAEESRIARDLSARLGTLQRRGRKTVRAETP